ncbi:MAG: ATP phosphoribosyltransferase regulatory subunit [Clostridia bacterium]|nr:ATP phosphoribosyltransferase regulatory subunit [Clostridia bacterium]
MENLYSVLTRVERAAFSLRGLYAQNGYQKYRMSKFEEYDLYAQNKDFLVSENVITFTDTDGRLMALKPDVTLSIIKNSKDLPASLTKVYYNENVYRVSKGTNSFQEIPQAGIECFGNVTPSAVSEVVYLAAKSLTLLAEETVLLVSHLDIVWGVLSAFALSVEGKKEIFRLLGEKNEQGVKAICQQEGLSQQQTALVCRLVTVYGAPASVWEDLDAFGVDDTTQAAVAQLKNLLSDLTARGATNVCVDFSVVNDRSYYNGVAFKGFIYGIPSGVVSGGQYDKLMQKLNKKSRAVGFAVYLGELDKLPEEEAK